jgi:hypothetical protein
MSYVKRGGLIAGDYKHAALDSLLQTKCGFAAKNMDANFDVMGSTVF